MIILGLVGILLHYTEDRLFNFLENVINIKLKKSRCSSLDCFTYRGLSLFLILIGIIFCVFMYIPLVIDSSNFPVFIGFIFMFVYPQVVMFIRKNTFNESSISYNCLGHYPRNMIEKCTGYCPMWYWLFSLMVAGSSTVWGFSMLNFSSIPISISLVILFSGLFFQTFILFPDFINKFVSVDMRTIKGLKLMLIISIILSITLIALRISLITFFL